MKTLLATPAVMPSDADAVIAYLRGDRTREVCLSRVLVGEGVDDRE